MNAGVAECVRIDSGRNARWQAGPIRQAVQDSRQAGNPDSNLCTHGAGGWLPCRQYPAEAI